MSNYTHWIGPGLQLLTLLIIPALNWALKRFISETIKSEIELTNNAFRAELLNHIEEIIIKPMRHELADVRNQLTILMSRRAFVAEETVAKLASKLSPGEGGG